MNMEKHVLLGIDVGTSSCQVAAFSLAGKPLASATEPYGIIRKTPYEAEQDAETWWQGVSECIRRILESRVFAAEAVAAIGVVGHSWATLPVDEMGNPLRPAMLWQDRRSVEECLYLREMVGEDFVLELSGNRIDPAYCVPKMLWIKAHEPHIYAQTHMFLQSNSFIVHKLTGAFTQDVSQGYGYYVFDTERRGWSLEACQAMGVDWELLPDVYESSVVVGEVTPQAAAITGLAAGTPVVAGGVDCAAACLGAGLIEHGSTQEQAGQAGGMTIVTSGPLRDAQLISGCHVVEEHWHLSGGTVSGGVLNWFLQSVLGTGDGSLSPNRGNPFEWLSQAAAQSVPGAGGLLFLPYMAGERTPIWDPRARGVLLGLSYDKTQGDLVRALMEGAAFALRHNLAVAGQAGIRPESLISVGGGARSKIWCQIKADITKTPVGIPNVDDGTVFGAAFLGGMGVGAFADWQTTLEGIVEIKRWYEPQPVNGSLYDELYHIYLETYVALKDQLHGLADLGSK